MVEIYRLLAQPITRPSGNCTFSALSRRSGLGFHGFAVSFSALLLPLFCAASGCSKTTPSAAGGGGVAMRRGGSPEAASLVRQAREAERNNDLDRAADLYARASERDPRNAAAVTGRDRVRWRLRNARGFVLGQPDR